ncbi:MAG: GntR family transcriptional regulator [Candidatus Sumerlaeia bacterium]|nr:GntR family transcriptional regulator [Candidatus Sumerlaeia bacterium]
MKSELDLMGEESRLSAEFAKFRSKKEVTCGEIRERILDGRLAPGQKITIDAISAELGVSHIPIREAFTQLSAEGLVFYRSYSGVSVSPLNRAVALEVLLLIELFESAFAQRKDGEQIAVRLAPLLDRLAEPELPADRFQLVRDEFSCVLCDPDGGMEFSLSRLLHTRVVEHWRRVEALAGLCLSAARRALLVDEHFKFVDAMRAGNARESLDLRLAEIHRRREDIDAAMPAPRG